MFVRGANDVRALVPSIQQLIFQADSRVIVRQPRLLTELVAERGTDDFLIGLRVTGAVGLFALILASIGVYGVLSFVVSQCTKELGLRMALGARRSDIIRLVLAQGLRFTAAGLVIGAVIAIIVARRLTSVFEGVVGLDAVSLGASVLALTTAALCAALIPSLRASKVDPMVALRHE